MSLASLDFPKHRGLLFYQKATFCFFCDMKNVKNLMSREFREEEPSANRKRLTENENNCDANVHEL